MEWRTVEDTCRLGKWLLKWSIYLTNVTPKWLTAVAISIHLDQMAAILWTCGKDGYVIDITRCQSEGWPRTGGVLLDVLVIPGYTPWMQISSLTTLASTQLRIENIGSTSWKPLCSSLMMMMMMNVTVISAHREWYLESSWDDVLLHRSWVNLCRDCCALWNIEKYCIFCLTHFDNPTHRSVKHYTNSYRCWGHYWKLFTQGWKMRYNKEKYCIFCLTHFDNPTKRSVHR